MATQNGHNVEQIKMISVCRFDSYIVERSLPPLPVPIQAETLAAALQ